MKREGNDNGCAEGWRGWAVLDGEPLQERDWLKERKKERAIVTVEPSDLVWYQQELSGARGEITGALITQTQTHATHTRTHTDTHCRTATQNTHPLN